MKYYKLSMDMERENDIICHYQNDYGIQQNALITGKVVLCQDLVQNKMRGSAS